MKFNVKGMYVAKVPFEAEVDADDATQAISVAASLVIKNYDNVVDVLADSVSEVKGLRRYCVSVKAMCGGEGDMVYEGEIIVAANCQDDIDNLISGDVALRVTEHLGNWTEKYDSLDIKSICDVTDDPDYASEDVAVHIDGSGFLQDDEL